MKLSLLQLLNAVTVALLLTTRYACGSDPDHGAAVALAEPGEELSGGDTTVFDATRNAFNFPAPNLSADHRTAFFVGNSFFNQNWVTAPASTAGRDGLGPLFNARSCSACHFKDGRSRPPEAGEAMTTMLLRISVPGVGEHGQPLPDPTYGGQLQGRAVLGVPPEGDAYVEYREVPGRFADGQAYSLREPAYSIRNLGYGPLARELMMSPRVAPAMVGMGLLEAVPAETLRSLADPDDRDSNGISGRINFVWHKASGKKNPGRFGWKAEQPTVLEQAATAFVQDIGITSSLMPEENYTAGQEICAKQPRSQSPEASDKILNDVVSYSRTLAVPARRNWTDPLVLRGKALFNEASCAACHVPKLSTGAWPEFPELSGQTIRPYTDLLLHDMGEGLADNRAKVLAVVKSSRVIDDSYLGELGATTKGMFALEYLLFDRKVRPSGEGSQLAAAVLELFSGAESLRRGQYVLALARDLQTKANEVAGDWVASGEQSASAKFIAGGQESLNRVVNQLAQFIEQIAEQRINLILQLRLPIAPQLDRIEGSASGTSQQSVAAMVRGVQRLYRGSDGGGLEGYVKHLNAPLAEPVEGTI